MIKSVFNEINIWTYCFKSVMYYIFVVSLHSFIYLINWLSLAQNYIYCYFFYFTIRLARNPPPLCAAIPGLKDLASICLQFYNLNVNSTSFSGCMRVVAKLKYVTVDKINIGCFKIPPSKSGARTVPKVQSKEFLAFVEKYMQAKRSDYKWLDLKKFDVRSLKWALETMKETYTELSTDYFSTSLKSTFIY